MDLATIWFVLIAVLWSGYFLLEGFDFGVGMLLPVLPRDEARAQHDVRVDRPRLGRQRGVAGDRRRRDLRRVPGVVRDDVLGLLPRAAAHPRPAHRARRLVRVARAAATARAGGRRGCWANTVGSVGAAVRVGRGARQPRARRPAELRRATSPATCSTSSTPTPSSPGIAVVALFALHGAVYLTLRTSGDLCERAALGGAAAARSRRGRRRGLPGLDGRRRHRPQRPRRLPAGAARGASAWPRSWPPSLLVLARRSGWAFVATAVGDGRPGWRRSSPACIRACSSRTRTSPTA